eukprot:evm.model.scf_2074.2 EVM.evm.TU.scf_2074.2   scf_2074:27154-27594(-)
MVGGRLTWGTVFHWCCLILTVGDIQHRSRQVGSTQVACTCRLHYLGANKAFLEIGRVTTRAPGVFQRTSPIEVRGAVSGILTNGEHAEGNSNLRIKEIVGIKWSREIGLYDVVWRWEAAPVLAQVIVQWVLVLCQQGIVVASCVVW